MFISPSVGIITDDTPVEWPKTEIWGWVKSFYALHLLLQGC